MNTDQYWSLIEESRKGFRRDYAEGNMDRQVVELKGLLSALPASEVIGFNEVMDDLLRRAYTWELWGAAHILGQGACSDDFFQYFRAWLISMGRRVYEAALANPDSLTDAAYAPGVEDFFFEDFLSIPYLVLEEMGAEIPESEGGPHNPPSGTDWRKNPNDLKEMFPRLWSRAQQRRRA